MATATVLVGVALARPPRADAFVRVRVAVDVIGLDVFRAETEIQLLAAQIAACDSRVVMAVSTEIVDLEI